MDTLAHSRRLERTRAPLGAGGKSRRCHARPTGGGIARPIPWRHAAPTVVVSRSFPCDVMAQPLERLPAPFDSPDWLYEIKYDGFRGLAFVDDGDNLLVSRAGNPCAAFVPWRSNWWRR